MIFGFRLIALKKLSAWLLAFAFLPAICAAEDMYRVEILIFTQPSEPADLIRRFEIIPDLGLAQTVDFRQYSCIPARPISSFPWRFHSEKEVEDCLNGYLRLNELRQPMVTERIRLEKSGQYRILYHAAWRQPVAPPDEAHPVRLTNGISLAQASLEAPAMDGSLKLSKERFLQLDLELLYHYPVSMSSEEPVASDGLLLQTRRKLRPNDLNYLDHPVIGVLAQITPMEGDPIAMRADARARMADSMR